VRIFSRDKPTIACQQSLWDIGPAVESEEQNIKDAFPSAVGLAHGYQDATRSPDEGVDPIRTGPAADHFISIKIIRRFRQKDIVFLTNLYFLSL